MPDKPSPVELVRAMVALAETFGYTLPWANLTDACAGIASLEELRWAVEDLSGEIEVTAKGLRFSLNEPTRVIPPGVQHD